MKVAFLDRDGTIIKDYPDKQWSSVDSPEFLDGALKGLKELSDQGFEIIIITNQYLINQGIISLARYERFSMRFLDEVKGYGVSVLDLFYCPHTPEEGCGCMKPADGMIRSALGKYPDIDLSESILIGDSDCDKGLALNVGLDFYGIKGGGLRDQEHCYSSLYDVSMRLRSEPIA